MDVPAIWPVKTVSKEEAKERFPRPSDADLKRHFGDDIDITYYNRARIVTIDGKDHLL